MSRNITYYALTNSIAVEVSIAVDKDYKPYKKGKALHHFGDIKINPTHTDTDKKEVFYDGIDFFIEVDLVEYIRECYDDLKEANYTHQEIVESFELIKEALTDLEKGGWI